MTETINQSNLYLLLPIKVCQLAEMLQKDKGISLTDAIMAVYASDTYKRLEREKSKAWCLGATTLYYDLKQELAKH